MMQWARVFSIFILAIIALPFIAMPVMADGMSWRHLTSSQEIWSQVEERSQFCIINFQNGTEKMIISIQVDSAQLESAAEMYWLFPVPSDPKNVDVNIMSRVPRLDGGLIGDEFKDSVADNSLWAFSLGTTVWGIPILILGAMSYSVGLTGGGGGPDVLVYDSVNAYGLSTAVITAENSSELRDYFELEDLTIPESDLALIDGYIASNYSFVATRISDLPTFKNSATPMTEEGDTYYMLGIEAKFSTDQIFFPLKLTSGYGDASIPILVQVLDYVDVVKAPQERVWLDVKVQYRKMDGYYQVPPYWGNDFPDFFAEQIENHPQSDFMGGYVIQDMKFTTIEINGEADALTEDLWMADSVPFSVGSTEFLIQNSWFVVFLAVLFISAMTGLITGLMIDPDRDKRHIRQYLIIGLCNVFTIFGCLIAYRAYLRKWHYEDFTPPKGPGSIRYMLGDYFGRYTVIFTAFIALEWGVTFIFDRLQQAS